MIMLTPLLSSLSPVFTVFTVFTVSCLVDGCLLCEDLLTYFAQKNMPFMMECCQRTEADKKGGHLALRTVPTPQLILRESAQCAKEDTDSFQDVSLHRFFNTNNLWVRLDMLKELMDSKGGFVPLPTIFNSKTVDPQLDNSPAVFQLEVGPLNVLSRCDTPSNTQL